MATLFFKFLCMLFVQVLCSLLKSFLLLLYLLLFVSFPCFFFFSQRVVCNNKNINCNIILLLLLWLYFLEEGIYDEFCDLCTLARMVHRQPVFNSYIQSYIASSSCGYYYFRVLHRYVVVIKISSF